MMLKHVAILMDLFLDYEEGSPQLFSALLKERVTEFAGEWQHGMQAMMQHGEMGLTAFLQALSFHGAAEICRKYPEHAMQATFALGINFLAQCYVQYKVTHSIK